MDSENENKTKFLFSKRITKGGFSFSRDVVHFINLKAMLALPVNILVLWVSLWVQAQRNGLRGGDITKQNRNSA